MVAQRVEDDKKPIVRRVSGSEKRPPGRRLCHLYHLHHISPPHALVRTSSLIRPMGNVGSPAARHDLLSKQMHVPLPRHKTKILSKLKAL